ncbi:MAG: universal stress protein [Rhodospirillaceae bacterium]|nr:universal stress protein [Rhodospirillaceae bacterium]
MKHILAAACIDPAPVFEGAFDLAEEFGAHVVGLGGSWPRQNILSWNENAGSVFVEGAHLLEHEEEVRNRGARKSFLAIASERGIPFRPLRGQAGPSAEWRSVEVPDEGSIGSFGRAFDLVIVERPSDIASFAQARLDGAILRSGRPVLMIPYEPKRRIGTRVVIVWRGSISCSRSVAMAMPLLTKADVIQVFSTKARALGTCVELERTLAAHASSITVRYLSEPDELNGPAVMAEARAIDADLIVAGAYCRGQILDLFGRSPTRSLMRSAEIPILFAH